MVTLILLAIASFIIGIADVIRQYYGTKFNQWVLAGKLQEWFWNTEKFGDHTRILDTPINAWHYAKVAWCTLFILAIVFHKFTYVWYVEYAIGQATYYVFFTTARMIFKTGKFNN